MDFGPRVIKAALGLGVAGLLAAAGPVAAWDLFASLSQGYTHYQAQDLNRVLVLMERYTNENGFNPYKVSQFDGHPQQALVLGFRHRGFSLGVETEFWVEDFHQSEVPFDLEEGERDYRITCATLRDPAYQNTRLSGCVEAREVFNFLPIGLQAAYGRDLGRHFNLSGGYGLGVMAGSASLEMKTQYFGEGAVADDRIKLEIWPGVNLIHKTWVDAEYLPWRYLGLVSRVGFRYSQLQGFSIRDQEGSSRLFSKVFPEARNGANLYFQSFTASSGDDKIYVGTEADAKALAVRTNSSFHLVNGDFTGWFLALKLNVYWRGI